MWEVDGEQHRFCSRVDVMQPLCCHLCCDIPVMRKRLLE
jgi:hypothetical protein